MSTIKDSYGREIDYLRLSVTDRCNLRCQYCMPPEGIDKFSHFNALPLEDYVKIVRAAVKLGIHKIRITGGEPLVRKNIAYLISEINSIPGINEISMTTNGVIFAEMAQELKAAGLDRVNFSLDTLNAERYANITRGGDISKVKESLELALKLNMTPVKINTVAVKGFNDDEIDSFVSMSVNYPFHIRFIELMPVGSLDFFNKNKVFTIEEIQSIISKKWEVEKEAVIKGNGPAKYWHVSEGLGSIGFISPLSNHFCNTCNRLRVNSEGKIRSCLLNNQEYDLRDALESDNEEDIVCVLQKAISEKPEKLGIKPDYTYKDKKEMYKIGG